MRSRERQRAVAGAGVPGEAEVQHLHLEVRNLPPPIPPARWSPPAGFRLDVAPNVPSPSPGGTP
jgi:hypothetical protein